MTYVESRTMQECTNTHVEPADGRGAVPGANGSGTVNEGLDSYLLGPLVAEAVSQPNADEGKLSDAAWTVIDMYLRSVGLDRSQVSVLLKSANEFGTGMYFFQARHGMKVEKGVAATADLAAIKAVDRLVSGDPKAAQHLVEQPHLVTSQTLSPDSLQGASQLLTLSPFRGPVSAIATDQVQGMYYVHVFATLEDGTVVSRKAVGTMPSRVDAIEKAIAGLIEENGGVQAPRNERTFEVAMSLARFNDLVGTLPPDSIFIYRTGKKTVIDGQECETISVVIDPEKYGKDQDYRARWDSFKTKVFARYDEILQNRGQTRSDLPQDIQGFLNFLEKPPQNTTGIR